MKNVKLLIKAASILLESALKPSEFRPFIKEAVLKKEYKSYLDNIFKGKDRIYLPFENKEEKKIPKNIEKVVTSKGYTIEDYNAGLAKNSKGRLIKIGKILSQEENSKELLEEFNTSRSNSKNRNLQIVISRHPYDIAGMSTGRGWTSCMNLDTGQNKHYVHKDIANGTIIAYLIEENDTNIKHPICRLLLKQFINITDNTKKILYPEKLIYGENIKGFKTSIIKWLKTFQDFKGSYFLNPEVYIDKDDDNMYNEDRLIGIGDKYSKDYRDNYLYYKNNPDDEDAKHHEKFIIREIYYQNHQKDKDAKNDYNPNIRNIYYRNYPDDEDAKFHKSWYIRNLYYSHNKHDKDAKLDDNYQIRQLYYKNHPNDEDAKNDTKAFIILDYYENNPNDPDIKYATLSKDPEYNLDDSYYEKLNKSLTELKVKYHKTHPNEIKDEIDNRIRYEYYRDNPDDKNGKFDKDYWVRYLYYSHNKHDKDAKFDVDSRIQKLYYINNPDDKKVIKGKQKSRKFKKIEDYEEDI